MKNKKGFTLIELLTVVVLLGILSTVAIISVTRYRAKVNEKEKITLRSTIVASFNNYRINNKVSKEEVISISDLRFTSDISYNNEKCLIGDESKIYYIVKGDYLESSADKDILRLGLCVTTTEIINDEAVTSCKKDLSNNYIPSKEEAYCVKLSCNGTLIINDYSNADSLCSE